MIEIKHIRENEKSKTVFFTMDYKGKEYDWHGDCPKSADPQAYFDAREDELRFYLLQRIYSEDDLLPDWQRFKTAGNTKLEAIEAWIDDGHKNQIIIGTDPETDEPIYDYIVIENHVYEGTHPLRYPPSQADLQEALDIINSFADTTFQELKDRVQQDEEFLEEISLVILALIRYIDHKSS